MSIHNKRTTIKKEKKYETKLHDTKTKNSNSDEDLVLKPENLKLKKMSK